jgi:hypothetical protein
MQSTIRILTIIVIALLLALIVVSISSDSASAHRVVSYNSAHKKADRYVRNHYCGGGGWYCASVSVPLVQCGYHTYCWRGTSFSEQILIWHRVRSSAGQVNGHNGRVTGLGEW